MKRTAVGLFMLWLLAAVPSSAEEVNIIFKSDDYEIGHLVNADADAVYMMDSKGVWRFRQDEIEAIFNAKTNKQIFPSQLWEYVPRHSLTLNVLSSVVLYPVLELEFYLGPATTVAVRGALNFQYGGPMMGGGFSYRNYPAKTAPRGVYFGGRVDYIGAGSFSLLTAKIEFGQKHYFKNGFVLGYFMDVGALRTGGVDGAGELAVILLNIVGGGVTMGMSF